MGVWDKPGHEDRQMLRRLRSLAEGYDLNGNLVDPQVQMEATRQWQAIQVEKGRLANDTARVAHDQMRAESDRMRAENDRLRAVAEAENLRASATAKLEQLQIAKADVVVRALEIATASGATADQILGAIADLNDRLLSSPREAVAIETEKPLALEDSEHKSEEPVPYYERLRRRRKAKKA